MMPALMANEIQLNLWCDKPIKTWRVPVVENGTTNEPRPKSVRVLIADPDESLHADYRESLLRERFDVDTALNGLECVSRLCDCTPDVLVIEPQLPWGGGDGVLAIMSENPDLKAVRVMVLTSSRDPRILKAISQYPISDYQLKPLPPARLAMKLHSLLDSTQLRFPMAKLDSHLECIIARRTNGRIRHLRVETAKGNVIVHGISHSHYVKQLALAAVQEAFDDSKIPYKQIDLNIDVLPDGDLLSPQDVLLGEGYDNLSNDFNPTKNSY
jgi:CheY-like chemotaxis protein